MGLWPLTPSHVGLHVHIGTVHDEGIPLRVLHHLGYIIVQDEEIISWLILPKGAAIHVGGGMYAR